MIPLDHLPEIGERILVKFDSRGAVDIPIPATVISMAECLKLQPELWTDAYGKLKAGNEKDTYDQDDTIRAWRYDEPHEGRLASFCIMAFRDCTGHRTYNKHVFSGAHSLPPMPSYEERMAVIKEDGPFL